MYRVKIEHWKMEQGPVKARALELQMRISKVRLRAAVMAAAVLES